MTTTTVTKEYDTHVAAAEPTDDVSAAKEQKEAERASDPAAESKPSVNVTGPVPSSASLQPQFQGPKTAKVTETIVRE